MKNKFLSLFLTPLDLPQKHRSAEKRREGEKGGRENAETERFEFSVSLSPCLLVSLSPCLPLRGSVALWLCSECDRARSATKTGREASQVRPAEVRRRRNPRRARRSSG